MPPEQLTNPEIEQVHPLETGIESLIVQNEEIKDVLQESNLLLQSIAIDSNNNDLERSLELQMLQSEENHKELVGAVKESSFNFQIDGVEMASITGPQGPKGEKGEKGDDGTVELVTPDGTVEKTNGKLTVQGIKGDKGDKGDTGPQGVEGPQGPEGIQGPQGERGFSGINGIDGVDGADGLDGVDGSPDTPIQIKKKLESLKDDDRLDVSAIKGIDKMQKDIKSAGQFTQTYQQYDVNGVLAGNGTRLNLKQGTNVTLSSATTSNGVDVTINSNQTTVSCIQPVFYFQLSASSTDYTELHQVNVDTNDIYFTVMPFTGSINNMYLYQLDFAGAAQPASGSFVATVRKNSVDTALIVTVPANSPQNTIIANTDTSISFSAGDKLSIKIVNNATATSGAFQISFRLTA